MLSAIKLYVTYNPFMLSAVMLNAVMLSVVASNYEGIGCFSYKSGARYGTLLEFTLGPVS